MKNSISLSYNKILKLTNVLEVLVDADDFAEFGSIVDKMDNFIKSRGSVAIGPIIQKTKYIINECGEFEIQIYLLRQLNNFIHNVEEPYKMESLVRVRNCIYAHYIGPEDKLKFAYDKINLYAFEEDIKLKNENYTIFIDQQDDNIVADVFVEKENE